jgi:threonylcarbamoyladenosine tRNA methylthiotransferase MtaB
MLAAFYTLGCKVNQYESEALKDIFRQAGYTIVPFSQQADVYVINSCTVTNLSDSKSRQAARRAARQNPGAVVAMIGCYAQVAPEEVEKIPDVDIIVGTDQRGELPRLVEKARQGQRINLVRPKEAQEAFEGFAWPEQAGRVRAFLKIQEGCQEYCSYCIIPYARGHLRSQEPDKVLQDIAKIQARGYPELVLTGTHLGAWGRDLQPPQKLSDLLYQIHKKPAPARIRLSSMEPVDVDDSLLEAFTDMPALCRHLHIPLQSGCDPILKAMERPYNTEYFRQLVRRLRSLDPDMALSTDIIVGFPGEEDAHFQETLSFVREMAFSRLHVFKFSPRQGTKAASFPHRVPPETIACRAEVLRKSGDALAAGVCSPLFAPARVGAAGKEPS